MNWVKIKTFDNLYQAEFIKEILEEQGIQTVVLNNRDSLFLIGEIEIYVPQEYEKKALAIIDEFYGLTKINSFIKEQPIRNYQKFVENKGIQTIFKERTDPRFVFKNYELYVKNEDLPKVKPYLDPYNIEGWKVVSVCHHVRQIAYRIDILSGHEIDSMVLKRKDANYKLQEVYLLVEEKHSDQAKKILEELRGWAAIAEYEKRHKAEIREELLSNNGIPAIICQKTGKFKLYVPEKDKDTAVKLLNLHKKWIKIRTYNSLIDAQVDQMKLTENGIDASIVTLKDSMFLIGGYELYVDEDQAQKALKILSETENES